MLRQQKVVYCNWNDAQFLFFPSSSCEESVERLTAELEHKTAMLMEVKISLKEAVKREKQIKELSTDTEVMLCDAMHVYSIRIRI